MTIFATPPPGEVLATASRILGISEDELRGRSLRRPLVHFRQVAMTACRWACADYGYPGIAREFGRDHTTVIHAVNKVNGEPRMAEMAREIAGAAQAEWDQRTKGRSGRMTGTGNGPGAASTAPGPAPPESEAMR